MARIVGIVLMLLAIYYGLSIYDGDRDAPGVPAQAGDPAQAAESAQGSGRAAPTAVTSRVRDRVNAAVAEGYHHSTGE